MKELLEAVRSALVDSVNALDTLRDAATSEQDPDDVLKALIADVELVSTKFEALTNRGEALPPVGHEQENIAAVSSVFHTHKRFDEFYRNNAGAVSGFPGIWRYCAEAGVVFTQVENGRQWDDGWIEAIDAYVEALITADVRPHGSAMRQLATTAIFEQHRAADPHCTCPDCVAFHFGGGSR